MAIFCNGKKAICYEVKCTKACPHYDGTGGYEVQTIIEKIRSTTEDEIIDFIAKLINGFDISVLFCDGEAGCRTEDGNYECNDNRQRECIRRWLNSPAPEVRYVKE